MQSVISGGMEEATISTCSRRSGLRSTKRFLVSSPRCIPLDIHSHKSGRISNGLGPTSQETKEAFCGVFEFQTISSIVICNVKNLPMSLLTVNVLKSPQTLTAVSLTLADVDFTNANAPPYAAILSPLRPIRSLEVMLPEGNGRFAYLVMGDESAVMDISSIVKAAAGSVSRLIWLEERQTPVVSSMYALSDPTEIGFGAFHPDEFSFGFMLRSVDQPTLQERCGEWLKVLRNILGLLSMTNMKTINVWIKCEVPKASTTINILDSIHTAHGWAAIDQLLIKVKFSRFHICLKNVGNDTGDNALGIDQVEVNFRQNLPLSAESGYLSIRVD
ncbi:hypothetical protein Hypma_004536 [Hypsizygus marmoreus]|uniref:Uncharacterized protein n=1 Tax=Hypsizygus marmoreus TaxID=39966 RepID=A0A369K3A6_HYPMA|nr:hypothetical protein Hypma_004536 [Hypsizygus marmoreus]